MFDGKFRSYFGAVAVPILDKGDGTLSNVTHDWANAMAGLGGGLAVTIMRLQIRNYRVDIAKERLAEMALANNCQFVYFADDDTIPPGDALMKMVKLWRHDPKYQMITGVYWSKSDPPVPLLFKGNLEGSYWDWTIDDLITVDGAGAGCLFVDTSIFKKLSKPWFSCNYTFEDPRSNYDLEKWNLTDQLGFELAKGNNADPKLVATLEEKIKRVGDKIRDAENGKFDPNLLKNRQADAGTTEDLYFFKKVKEELGIDLWADCSIQCQHQDKRTGKYWGLTSDMPQAHHRWEGKFTPDNKVVLDIGCGDANYFIAEGKPIRIDIDERVKPDIVADARFLPIEDCFADQVNSSHLLEHFSFHETISVLREWARVLKIGGRMVLVVPNLKWSAKRMLNPTTNQDEMKRAMFFYHSAQKGDLREAYDDCHRAGFIPESLLDAIRSVGVFGNIEVTTTEGNFANWNDPGMVSKDGTGYNIIAFATKIKHDAPVSLKVPLKPQEEAKYKIGVDEDNHTTELPVKQDMAERRSKPKKEKKKPKKKK